MTFGSVRESASAPKKGVGYLVFGSRTTFVLEETWIKDSILGVYTKVRDHLT